MTRAIGYGAHCEKELVMRNGNSCRPARSNEMARYDGVLCDTITGDGSSENL